jgi:hypothetical protein
LLEATTLGRRCQLLNSRVSDDAIRTATADVVRRLGDAMGWRHVENLGERGEWVTLTNAMLAVVEQIGARLREPRSLALPGASVTSTLTRLG